MRLPALERKVGCSNVPLTWSMTALTVKMLEYDAVEHVRDDIVKLVELESARCPSIADHCSVTKSVPLLFFC